MKHAEAMRLLLSRQEDKFEKKIRELEQESAKVKEALGAIGGREQVYRQQIEKLQNETSDVLSEKARFEAETEAQEAIIRQLKDKLSKETEGKQSVEVERESINLRLSTIMTHNDETKDELHRMREQYQRLLKEKERTEVELSMATGEVDQLKHGQKCGCVVS